MRATAESLRHAVLLAIPDPWDQEDALLVSELLLRRFGPLDAQTWLSMPDGVLGGTPLVLIGEGRVREVVVRAREIQPRPKR